MKVSSKFRTNFLFFCLLYYHRACRADNSDEYNGSQQTQPQPDARPIFSPRMDYESWKPLGRGDPLQNDPTFDYVPPVLDRVHYWIDGRNSDDTTHPKRSKEKRKTEKTEILVLGVSSKKPSTESNKASSALYADDYKPNPHIESRLDYEPFLKFIEAPKFSFGNYYRPQKHQYMHPTGYYGSSYYSKNQYPIQEEKVPQTMLIPPNLHEKPQYFEHMRPNTPTNITNTYPTTPASGSSVSIAASNLIFQSSMKTSPEKWSSGDDLVTVPQSSNVVQWYTTPGPEVNVPESSENKVHFHEPHQVVFDDPKSSITFGDSLMFPGFGSHHEVMHKGHVTDEVVDDYVNIKKPSVQTDPMIRGQIVTFPNQPDPTKMKPPKQTRPYFSAFKKTTPSLGDVLSTKIPGVQGFAVNHRTPMPMTLHMMETMQTMQPPPMAVTDLMDMTIPVDVSTKVPTSTVSPNQVHGLGPVYSVEANEVTSKKPWKNPGSIKVTQEEPAQKSTTESAFTTDPLFSHYKQPSAPLRGPMYLIIEGHSKVKKYGAGKNSGKGNRQDNTIERTVSGNSYEDDDDGNRFSVKHLHSNEDIKVKESSSEKSLVSKDLQTLQHVLDTGLGSLDLNTLDMRRKRGHGNETTTELSRETVGSSTKEPSRGAEVRTSTRKPSREEVRPSTNKPSREVRPSTTPITNGMLDRMDLGAFDDRIKFEQDENEGHGFWDFLFADEEKNRKKRSVDGETTEVTVDENKQETEVKGRYKVVAGDYTSEKYRKGIVENDEVSLNGWKLNSSGSGSSGSNNVNVSSSPVRAGEET